MGTPIAIYDRNLIMKDLMWHGMSEPQALEAFQKEVAGQWYGVATPLIIDLIED